MRFGLEDRPPSQGVRMQHLQEELEELEGMKPLVEKRAFSRAGRSSEQRPGAADEDSREARISQLKDKIEPLRTNLEEGIRHVLLELRGMRGCRARSGCEGRPRSRAGRIRGKD
ncbi:hypothetical protein CYMTET_40469 [Cymbomonas tetramitiformis]|uniref:Uncharacterized protein n=1 Tax=Cymbomonas tetramitiformis TaxID=36881 RepID=A0AAE0C995_9CHLO|nr:hypothetical protein CYMTET_40469 [Cymbomonas tetramitiformis]